MPDVDERRWLSQEAARDGQGGDRADRAVALALRAAPGAELPDDFASLVAARALAQATQPSPRFEQSLVALALGLLISAVGCVLWWSPQLMAQARQALSQLPSTGWAAWLGLALLLTALQPHIHFHRKPL